jgi:hypothetical protein
MEQFMPTIRVFPGETNPKSNYLQQFAERKYSQNGEEGILRKIFEIIGIENAWCAEFGAYDGVTLSNTHDLIRNQNWSGVLIEADNQRFAQLAENYAGIERAHLFNNLIQLVGKGTLDDIFSTTSMPHDVDLVSIDVDGVDWHLWRSLGNYYPRVVVIEFNPTMPNDVYFVQDADPKVNQGNSLRAILQLGKDKGYELICVHGVNAFFVRKELFPSFGISDNSIDAMFSSLAVTYLLQGYDGSIWIAGCKTLCWKGVDFDESKLQVLPPDEIGYPGAPNRSN